MFSKLRLIQFSLVLLLAFAATTAAQSLDASTPAPIRSTSLMGRIAARDLGDSRLTDHYYAFTGTPGDLLITIQTRNLNGDLDVFTAGSLRPLLKLALYAENTSAITKGIYLRKREDLILRIEARSPNDDDGMYQLFFGGSFQPIVGGPDIAENSDSTNSGSLDPKSRRVSSVGARLPEPEKPVTEVASTPTPEPTPEEKPEEPKPVTPKRTATTSTARTRRPTGRRTSVPVKPKPDETTAETESKTEESTPVTEPAKPKTTTGRRRGSTAAARAAKPKVETPVETTPAEPEMGPRLVIETSDGTLINRSMSTVRRVIVENGQVVVTAKDGKIDRIPLANVVRMSIAP
ncbi:MAG TPA: hypothetical protein VI306_15675 [Pyrinomonadaceae bacterium]